MSVRVYLAAGPDGLRSLADDSAVEAPAYAVSAAMRAADPRADEEDLEYEAALRAEEHLREAGSAVVVVAADVAACVHPADDGRVDAGRVPLSSVVSFHVAEHGSTADEELLWFDVTELDQVLAYLGG